MSSIREIDSENYFYDDVDYKEVGTEIEDIDVHLQRNENLIQKGPQGCGKTLSFAYYAAEYDVPCVIFDCSRDTKQKDLVVRPWIETKNGQRQTVHIPGALLKSIILANEYDDAILVFDEINTLPPKLQKMINRIGDWRRKLNVTQVGRTFKLEPSANLLIGGTMNPHGMSGGTFNLNEDLRSRFSEIERPFPDKDNLEDILAVNDVSAKIGKRNAVREHITAFSTSTYSLYNSDEVSYVVSPRDAVRLGKMWKAYYENIGRSAKNPEKEGLRRALSACVIDKYREDEESLINDEIENSFGVSV